MHLVFALKKENKLIKEDFKLKNQEYENLQKYIKYTNIREMEVFYYNFFNLH